MALFIMVAGQGRWFSTLETLFHARSLAGFIITTCGFRFSVQTGLAGQDCERFLDQDRHTKAECLNARRDLLDLLLGVDARVSRVHL